MVIIELAALAAVWYFFGWQYVAGIIVALVALYLVGSANE